MGDDVGLGVWKQIARGVVLGAATSHEEEEESNEEEE
jgi:hypothetical protein